MRILQLCKKFPFPLKDGESIAVTTLSKAMTDLGCEVTLLAMNTTKHFYEGNEVPPQLRHYDRIYTVRVDNRIRAWDAFKNLFSAESFHVSRFVSERFHRQLTRLLREKDFDLIQLETLYLAPYISTIRQNSQAPVAMRAHNVEHEIWERIAQNTRFLPRKWYLEHLTKKLKRFESEQLSRYDILVPISERDLLKFKELAYFRTPATVSPIGISPHDYIPDPASFRHELSIAFIGSLDWMPNQEGLRWFLDTVWSRVSGRFPQLKLHIAGRHTPEWLFRLQRRNVIVHGEVPDATEFINAHSLMVVPLLSGSGMRAKILEGMALGKMVISTPLGLEGIRARHGEHVLVADSADSFQAAIQFCYDQQHQLPFYGERAREFIFENYDSQAIARRLLDVYAPLTVEAI